MLARASTPEVAKASEELERKTSPKARKLKELVDQDKVKTYHNRREGTHAQRGDRQQRSTTKEEMSSTANPDGARSKGDTEREGRQDRDRRKAQRVPKEVAAGGSRLKSTDGGIVPRGNGLLNDAGPRTKVKKRRREAAAKMTKRPRAGTTSKSV